MNAGGSFDRDVWIVEALTLHSLFLRGEAIGNGLTNLRIGIERRLNSVTQFDAVRW